MKSLLRFSRAFLAGRKKGPAVVLLAFMTGAFVSRSNAVAEDTRPAAGPDLSSGTCSSTATTLCLNDNRFSAAVSWRVPDQGRSGQGASVPLSGDTGLFWFFDASNIELVVKVLDGTGVNGSYWVFYAGLSNLEYTITVTDLETGRVRTYDNPSGSFASFADTSAFANTPGATAGPAQASQKALESRSSRELYALFEAFTETRRVHPKTAAPCEPGGTTLCLAGSRFQVTVDWDVPSQDRSGQGIGVPISTDTGYFWFFNDANVEVAVKVLDARAIDGHFWVFVAALSNLKYTLRVTDTQTGMTKAWDNPEGQLGSWADTGDFSDSSSPPPPPGGLSGTWTGSILFFYPPDPTEALDVPCQRSAPITVNLVESGDGHLSGQFEAGCSGALMLSGVVSGGTIINGWLDSSAGHGRISGALSANRIQFWTRQDFSDGDDPDGDRDDHYISSRVDLTR
jgi:hypothetical protein